MRLGIPAVMVREEDGSKKYEDSFVMMHFMVATAIATTGLHISDTNKMYPIFVQDTRSGHFYKNSSIKLPKKQKKQVQIRMWSYDRNRHTHPRK